MKKIDQQVSVHHAELVRHVEAVGLDYDTLLSYASCTLKSLEMAVLLGSRRERKKLKPQLRDAKRTYASLERGFAGFIAARQVVEGVRLAPNQEQESLLAGGTDSLAEPAPSPLEQLPNVQ